MRPAQEHSAQYCSRLPDVLFRLECKELNHKHLHQSGFHAKHAHDSDFFLLQVGAGDVCDDGGMFGILLKSIPDNAELKCVQTKENRLAAGKSI